MLTIPDFQLKLKEIDPDFEIRVNPHSPEIAGVYWKGYCAYIGLPANEIFQERNPSYSDAYGNPHRTSVDVLNMAQAFLRRIESEPEYKDLITTDDFREDVKVPKIAAKQ